MFSTEEGLLMPKSYPALMGSQPIQRVEITEMPNIYLSGFSSNVRTMGQTCIQWPDRNTFTFEVSLWRSGLPCLHKDNEGDHISNHNGKSQADHEHDCQEAIENSAAAHSAKRRQWRLAWVGPVLSSGGQVERRLCRWQQRCGTAAGTDVWRQCSHGPGLLL